MFQIETLGDRPREEEIEDRPHEAQDHPPEVAEVAEVAEAVEVVEEHSHHPDMHLPNQLKNF